MADFCASSPDSVPDAAALSVNFQLPLEKSGAAHAQPGFVPKLGLCAARKDIAIPGTAAGRCG
jgi:hypothetical protein